MRRIPVDFNTLTSAPVGEVKFHAVAPLTGESYEDLVVGERVELFETEATTALAVQATITSDGTTFGWLLLILPPGAMSHWPSNARLSPALCDRKGL